MKFLAPLLFLIFLVFFACTKRHTPVPPVAGSVQAHWIKKGEKAPFDGILLSKETYGKLRLKIILLEEQLRQCQESK